MIFWDFNLVFDKEINCNIVFLICKEVIVNFFLVLVMNLFMCL